MLVLVSLLLAVRIGRGCIPASVTVTAASMPAVHTKVASMMAAIDTVAYPDNPDSIETLLAEP